MLVLLNSTFHPIVAWHKLQGEKELLIRELSKRMLNSTTSVVNVHTHSVCTHPVIQE